MALDSRVLTQLRKSMSAGEDAAVRRDGARQATEVAKLVDRVHKLIALTGISPAGGLDLDSLDLACHALHLPPRRGRSAPDGRAVRSSLRQRSEDAIEMLIRVAGKEVGEELLERTARLLREMHHRTPSLPEARVLADAVSLDDFGAVGLLRLAVETGRRGGNLLDVADGIDKRIQYGYWEARLKEGFHFSQTREIARRRLEHSKQFAQMLRGELAEDSGNP